MLQAAPPQGPFVKCSVELPTGALWPEALAHAVGRAAASPELQRLPCVVCGVSAY
jgi:hypothetical protein